MRPNDGREAAYVTSRVKDLSNVPAPTEYLPLFTCLTPKGTSTDPVLIRDVETLVEEFGDPVLNPSVYCDLLTIKDFVRGGRSCWVNRVDTQSLESEYTICLYDTVPVGIRQWFYYKNWDNLTEEQKAIVDCGWNGTDGDLTFINENNERFTLQDLDIHSYRELVLNRDLLLEKTGWEMRTYPNEVPVTTVFHNHNQQLSAYDHKGKKYCIIRQECSYKTEEDVTLLSNSNHLKIDANSKIVRTPEGAVILEPIKLYSVKQESEDTFVKKEWNSESGLILITSVNGDVYDRINTTNGRLRVKGGTWSRNYGVDANYNLVYYQTGELVYSVDNYLLYLNDECINPKVNRTLIDGDTSIDISYPKPLMTYTDVLLNILKNRGITLNFYPGYPTEEFLIAALGKNGHGQLLSKDPVKPELFNLSTTVYWGTDRYLDRDEGVIVFTSAKKLIPSSAGWTINYVLRGYMIGVNYTLVEDSISLPEVFTDQEFIDKLNTNPYIKATALYPDSYNLYRLFTSGIDLGLVYSVMLTKINFTPLVIGPEHYASSIRKYEDPKYNGCFIGDLKYPTIDWYLYIQELTEDDRKMLQWVIKDVASKRKDLTCIFTTPDLPLNEACNWVAARGDYSDYYEYGERNTDSYSEQAFYCEMYHGWMSYKTALVDGSPYKIDKLPPTVFIMANIIDSWKTKGRSFPVAGDQGGVLNSSVALVNVKDNPDTKSKRDKLVSYRINPIWDTGLRGIQIYGNETLNPQYSDLSAAHIARMVVQIRSEIDRYTETIKFKLNNKYTWDGWINYVSTKVLEPYKTEGGLVWYSVDMGRNTTTPEQIAQRKIRGVVGLQFRPDLEIVDLEFVVYASSLELGE